MQTPHKAANLAPTAMKTHSPERPNAKIEKLAAFIQHHHHLKEASKSADNHSIVELRGNKHVAEHLHISVAELEHGYETLSKDQVIKRHGEYRIEILNKAQLAELAKHAKQ